MLAPSPEAQVKAGLKCRGPIGGQKLRCLVGHHAPLVGDEGRLKGHFIVYVTKDSQRSE
jgi:hypothetical protein